MGSWHVYVMTECFYLDCATAVSAWREEVEDSHEDKLHVVYAGTLTKLELASVIQIVD